MIRRILLAPFFLVEPWLRHPNWMVRRAAQIVMFGIAIIWLLLPSSKAAERGSPKPTDELALRLSTSTQLQEFIHGPAIGKPIVGRICRILVLRLSVIAKLSERARDDNRNFVLRLDGPIDQAALRSLLIWQNHVLPSYCRDDGNLQVDVTLVLASGREDEARLFDLFSIALMLERFRSFAAFWDEATAAAAATKVMSEGELIRWRTAGQASDLEKIPREIISQVELCGTTGGVKLFTHGRKYANDFFKLALPARFIIAIGLRERADGTVEAGELDLWLGLIEKLGARRSDVAFVVLKGQRPNGEDATRIAKELRDWVGKEIGAIAKPKDIRFGDNLPKTRSGKIMRRLLRSIAKGEEIKQDVSTLENPAILDQLKQTM